MLRRRLCISPCEMRCHSSTSKYSSSGSVTAGKRYKLRTCRPRISQGGSIEGRSGSLGGKSRVLQPIPCHIAGIGSGIVLLKENVFRSERSTGHVGEGPHTHSVGL